VPFKDHDDLELGAMEFFILAVIGKARLTSMYALQQRAGLQPGGIRPALRRLERLGFINRAQSSIRQRRELSLTTRGEKSLAQARQRYLQDYPDAESVMRAACVALLMGDQQAAADYLLGQAGGRDWAAKDKKMEAERLEKTQRDPLSTYAWMRALTEARRRSAEGEAFSRLGQFLTEKYQPDASTRT
jgi:DNA-binding MarR family transcriptional regulator